MASRSRHIAALAACLDRCFEEKEGSKPGGGLEEIGEEAGGLGERRRNSEGGDMDIWKRRSSEV